MYSSLRTRLGTGAPAGAGLTVDLASVSALCWCRTWEAVWRGGVTGIPARWPKRGSPVRMTPVDLRRWILEEHRSIWSRLVDGVVDRVPTDRWAEHPDSGGSCIGFLLFHTSVHADYAGRVVSRGLRPLLADHRDALGLAGIAPERGVGEAEDAGIVSALVMPGLLEYARAVHEDNAAWFATLDPDVLDTVLPASDRLTELAGLAPDALPWLRNMWSDKPVWWHAQWEMAGHLLNHVGEMVAVRNRMGLSPF